MQNLKCKMQNFKLTQLITIAFFSLVFLLSSFVPLFSADLSVESGGKLKTATATFVEQAASPAQKGDGTGGRVVYQNDHVYVSDGSGWNAVAGGKTVATRIVGVGDRDADGVVDDGESRLTGKTADYICGDGTYPTDQEYINTAITEVGNAGGGAVYLLEGTYNISASINMASNVALIGVGAGTILNKASSTEFSVISANSVSNILISLLQIDGSLTAGAGVDFNTVTYSKIDKIWVKKIKRGTPNKAGISFGSSNNNIISASVIKDVNFDPSVNTDGINLSGSSSNNIISHNYISQCSESAIYIGTAAQNNIVRGNMLINATNAIGDPAILARGNNTVICNNIVSYDIPNSGNSGICVDGDYCLISGNSLSNNANEGIVIGFEFDSTTPSYTIVSNNSISNNGKEGIKVNKSEGGNTISGNMLYNNGGSGVYDGIYIDTDSSNNLISGNYIYDLLPASDTGGGYGINIDTGSANNYLTANYIEGKGYVDPAAATPYDRRIRDLGATGATGTRYTGKDKITVEPVSYAVSNGGRIDLTSTGTGPVTYLRLDVSGGVDAELAIPNSISDGKAIGDMLILENTSTNTIRLRDESTGSNSNFEIRGSDDNRTLSKNTTAKFIWNGTAWLELVHADN